MPLLSLMVIMLFTHLSVTICGSYMWNILSLWLSKKNSKYSINNNNSNIPLPNNNETTCKNYIELDAVLLARYISLWIILDTICLFIFPASYCCAVMHAWVVHLRLRRWQLAFVGMILYYLRLLLV